MKNKNGFISMTLVYTFLILFLFLLLSILSIFAQKNKLLDVVNEKLLDETKLNNNYTNTYVFGYKGSIDAFVVPRSGFYRLEVWGAQGGTSNGLVGGYGAYATGVINLRKNRTLYIAVGGKGNNGVLCPITSLIKGGYNGGGDVATYSCSYNYLASGGGATSISSAKKLLKDSETLKDSIYIVAAGGSGAMNVTSGTPYQGGHGGGIKGHGYYSNPLITNQTAGNLFGLGGQKTGISSYAYNLSAGGGGYYGGGALTGGSSFLNPDALMNSSISCFTGCTSSSTHPITNITPSSSATATANAAKQENGYAKITYLGTSYSGS